MIVDVVRFVNSPVSSNSYIVCCGEECLVIDPGTRNPDELIAFIKERDLKLRYTLLTHEHFDHVWGVNYLRDFFDFEIVCSKKCSEKLSIPQNYFNLLYFNDPAQFTVDVVDILIDDTPLLKWNDIDIYFILTPGHSSSSICIYLDGFLFTGDTILKGCKPVIKKRHEGSIVELRQSVNKIFNEIFIETKVYPGHGDSFILCEVKDFYLNFIN